MPIDTSRGKKIDPSKFVDRKKENESFEFLQSKFNFLKDHFGFRKGCVHMILGTTGSGKSTLVRSILVEILNSGKRTLIYSCEEDIKDFEINLAYVKEPILTDKLRIFHESDMIERTEGVSNIEDFIKQLHMCIVENEIEILIFDNITTSNFYEQNKKAAETATKLKALCEKTNIPFLIVAHTSASIREGMFFDASCIRGFRTIANTAQYLYCYYRVRDSNGGLESVYNFLCTDKGRRHAKASKSCYRLFFDHETRMFNSDQNVNYELFKKYLRQK